MADLSPPDLLTRLDALRAFLRDFRDLTERMPETSAELTPQIDAHLATVDDLSEHLQAD